MTVQDERAVEEVYLRSLLAARPQLFCRS